MSFYQAANSTVGVYNMIYYESINQRHHFHRSHEFIFVDSGEVEAQIDGEKILLKENDYLLVPSNSVHYYSSKGNSCTWVAVFSEDHVQEFSDIIKEKDHVPCSFHCPEDITAYLKAHLFTNAKTDRFTRISCLYMVCGEFLKTAEPKEKKKADLPAQRIIDYIEKNFTSDINMKDIARELGYEYHYFSRCFGEIFHTNFRTFINRYRFEKANELLKKGGKSKTEVALLSGFGSIRNFNRVYKDFSGKKPSDNDIK